MLPVKNGARFLRHILHSQIKISTRNYLTVKHFVLNRRAEELA